MAEDSSSKLLTVANVAAVYQAIKENRLVAKRMLNRWAIRSEAAEAWKPHGYKDRPGPKRRGRKKGTQLSEETRLRMSESAKRGWFLPYSVSESREGLKIVPNTRAD